MEQNEFQRMVSIITPAYKPTADLIRLGKVLNIQTYQEFEWIVVDDGSGSSYSEVFDRLCDSGIKNLRLVRLTENVGQAKARNVGLEHATGSYIKFIDADDMLDEHHVQCLLEATIGFNGKRQIAFSPTKHIYTTTGKSRINISYEGISRMPEEQLVSFLEAPFLSHCGALFPAQLLRDLGGYDANLVTDEDGDLLIRILLNGWSYVAVPECHYIYRHDGSSGRVSIDDNMSKLNARKQVCINVLNHYRTKGVSMPYDVVVSLCKRIDGIAVKSYLSHPKFSKEMFKLASEVSPHYHRSGNTVECVVRRLLGVSIMLQLREFYYRIRR